MALAAGASMHRANADSLATWNGSTSTWSNAADWSGNTVPTTGYDVTINSGSIALNVNPAIQLLAWSGGTLSTGQLSVAGGIILAGAGTDTLSNATLSNAVGQAATIGTDGNVSLSLQNGAQFANSGTFTASNGSLVSGGGNTSLFNNFGTFNVNLSNTTNTFTVSVPMTNDSSIFSHIGFVDVQAGTLSLTGGDNGFATGNFTIAAGATLAFNGGTYNLAFSSVTTGLGTAIFNSGTFNFGTNAATLASPVNIAGGTFNGTTGSLTTSSTLTWSAGTLAVTTKANGGLTFAGGGTDTLSNTSLTNAVGQAATIGTGSNVTLSLQTGAQFINAGTFTASNGAIASGGGTTSLFTNTGTFNVNLSAPTNTFTVGIPMANSGTVHVQSGTLSLTAGDNGSTTGAFNISSGATLAFNGGTYNFASSATTTGAGTAAFNTGTFNFGANAVTLASPVSITGGTFNGTTGSLTTSGMLTWSAGTLAVTTKAKGGLTLAGDQVLTLSNATLTNAAGQTATMDLPPTAFLFLQTGAQFVNAGTLTASNGAILGDTSLFTNTGTFNVNLSDSTNFEIDALMANSGTIHVQVGTLSLIDGDGGTTTGTFDISAGASLTINGGTYNFASSATTTGLGTASFNNGTFNFGANAVTFASPITLNSTFTGTTGSLTTTSTLTWSSGTIAVNTNAKGGLILGGQSTLSNATLTNALGQTATIGTGGDVDLFLQTGAQFINAGTFTASDGNIANGVGATATLFTNTGTFNVNLSASTNTFTVATPMANSGTVHVQSGLLSLTGGDAGSTTGIFNLDTHTTLTLNGNYTLTGAATLVGAGTANIASGKTILHNGLTSLGALTVGGTLQFASNAGTSKLSTLTITGSNNSWSGKIDLTNNRLILESTASAKTAALSLLQNQVNFGKTSGAGIFSSTLPANQGLAVAENSLLTTPFTLFGGLPVDPNSLLIAPELLGDTNLDGAVNATDLNTVLTHLGTTTPNWTSGNFDNAPTIDLTDLNDVLNNLGQTFANPTQSSPTPTPEPTSLALLAIPPLVPLLRRRRRPS
jgi:fibronectin-binding autotransporter adhesin